jgi:hypothetical protein
MSPSGPIAVNPTLMKSLPYDPIADFTRSLAAGHRSCWSSIHRYRSTRRRLVKYAKEGEVPAVRDGHPTLHHLFNSSRA